MPVYATFITLSFLAFQGPEAMYVKLISSDGHEFIIKRDHALTSGTIKAMLSGPGQFSENETNEVNFREIPSHVLQKVREEEEVSRKKSWILLF